MDKKAQKMSNKKQIHKTGLLKLYIDQLNSEESKFMKIVLENAIYKLEHDVDSRQVENWVVKLEKLWRTF